MLKHPLLSYVLHSRFCDRIFVHALQKCICIAIWENAYHVQVYYSCNNIFTWNRSEQKDRVHVEYIRLYYMYLCGVITPSLCILCIIYRLTPPPSTNRQALIIQMPFVNTKVFHTNVSRSQRAFLHDISLSALFIY